MIDMEEKKEDYWSQKGIELAVAPDDNNGFLPTGNTEKKFKLNKLSTIKQLFDAELNKIDRSWVSVVTKISAS